MARPPKSTAALKLHGTYRKDRHGNRADVAFQPGEPEKPADLDADALWLWETVVGNLPPSGRSRIDAPLLWGMARWWSQWRQFDAELKAGEGDPYKVMVMAAAAWKQFEGCASRFGMSPAARAALKLPADETPTGKLAKYVQ